jgi:Ca2+:H+ antiporter
VKAALRTGLPLLVSGTSVLIIFLFGDPWFADLSHAGRTSALFVWIFLVMMWSAFTVVRHADALAEILGEPYGTLILTFSVVGIEVTLISAIMLAGDENPVLARDTMFSALMIVLNGVVGLALLMGGLRHREQDFNLKGARAFMTVLTPLAVIALVLPNFTVSTPDPSLSPLQAAFFGTFTLVLYGVFLAIQTVRHRGFFLQPDGTGDESGGVQQAEEKMQWEEGKVRFVLVHGILLFLNILPIVLLSEELAHIVEYGADTLGAPPALGGLLVAILVLAPEAMSALKSALRNRLQRAVNICLGSALSTIGVTVPAVLLVGHFIGHEVILGLSPVSMILLTLTLVLGAQTFGGVRTNLLQGAVHLTLFFVFVVLIFSP